MKKLIFLTALMSLFVLKTYSQVNKKFKMDTTFKSISDIINQKPLIPDDFNVYSKLLDGSEGNKFLFPKQSYKDFALPTDKFGNIDKAHVDNMPLINPKGNFHMRAYKPDFTMRYSLIIK